MKRRKKICRHRATLCYPGIGFEWCTDCGAYRELGWRGTNSPSAWRTPGRMTHREWELKSRRIWLKNGCPKAR